MHAPVELSTRYTTPDTTVDRQYDCDRGIISNNGQNHLALGDIAANTLFEERASCMSATVPLDRALLSSYRLSMVYTIPLSVTVWPEFVMQILTGFPTPNISFPWRAGSLSNTTLLGTTRVSQPKGHSLVVACVIRFRSAARTAKSVLRWRMTARL